MEPFKWLKTLEVAKREVSRQ